MTTSETPFEKVYNRLRDLVPHLEMQPGRTVQATTLVQQWLTDGCDADLDILPAINKTFANMTGRPTSPAYFDKAVRAAKEQRCGSAEAERRKAERIAWVRANMPSRYESDAQMRGWMKQYESENGSIA
jgi:hypothetical protein